jgi:hypothetical protein
MLLPTYWGNLLKMKAEGSSEILVTTCQDRTCNSGKLHPQTFLKILLTVEARNPSEELVTIYQTRRCYILEDHILDQLENLSSDDSIFTKSVAMRNIQNRIQ